MMSVILDYSELEWNKECAYDAKWDGYVYDPTFNFFRYLIRCCYAMSWAELNAMTLAPVFIVCFQ